MELTAQREKGNRGKRTSDPLELGTYALSRSFSHASHGNQSRYFVPHRSYIPVQVCRWMPHLRPAPRGWYCVLCDGSRLSGA